MKIGVLALTLCFAVTALAAEPSTSKTTATNPNTGTMQTDLTKVGPLARKPTSRDTKAVEALIKASDDAWKKGDMQALAAMHDFPIFMATDDMKGAFMADQWSREQFLQMMGDMSKSMPKDMKVKHALTTHLLSDNLALVVDEPTLTVGNKELGKYKTATLLINRGGKWLFKGGAEAGWGDWASQQQAGAAKP